MTPLLAKRLSDESLGSRLASGEAAAFDELYRRYVHRLAAYGAHLLGDGVAGDDVAQATLLKAYSALRDGRVPDRVRPWLYRIAHNVAIDLVARRREWPTAELPEQGVVDAAPLAGVLVEALAALPDRQRSVYVLRELHGLRIDETAAELSLSAAQVEQSLFAARNRLAEHLVFGDRLTCVSVRRLAAGPLDADERRALKSHLRSCPDCRSGVGLRARALAGFPVASLGWLRGLVAGSAGGSAPVVAKVGAAMATVSLAAGVPAAVETVHVHHAALPAIAVRVARPTHPQPTHRQVVRLTPAATAAAKVAQPKVVQPKVVQPVTVAFHESLHRGAHKAAAATHDRSDDHGRGGGGSDDARATVTAVGDSRDSSGRGSSGDGSQRASDDGSSDGGSSNGGSSNGGSDDGTLPALVTVATASPTVVLEPSSDGGSGSGSGSGDVTTASSDGGGGHGSSDGGGGDGGGD